MKSSLIRTQPPTVNDAESSMIAVMLIFKFIYNQFMMLDDDYFSQMRVRVVTSNSNTIKIKLDRKLYFCSVSYNFNVNCIVNDILKRIYTF